MGKSSKKSATKADIAATVALVPTKKGKRVPEKAIEKQLTAKKQKKADKHKADTLYNQQETATSDSDSEDEHHHHQDPDAKSVVPSKNGTVEIPATDDLDATVESESEDDELVQDSKESYNSDEESSGEDSSEEEDEKPTAKKNAQTPGTPQVQQSSGSKTLFIGNLSFSVEQADVEIFFKEAGEIAEIRFATDREGAFKGFGHVEFATVEAAQQALKLNGRELLGRQVKLDLARERGSSTPQTGNGNSHQKGGKAQGQTIFVRGFDTNDGEDKIRSALEEHFGSCGEISRVSIPKDYEGGVKGIAYMDFADSDGFKKALELGGTELGESILTVEEAKPRGDSRDGRGGGGGRSSGRFGSGGGRFRSGSGGRFGGRDSGGRRGGGRFVGRRGGGGGGGRGRGSGRRGRFDD